jgi:hypothetical protein
MATTKNDTVTTMGNKPSAVIQTTAKDACTHYCSIPVSQTFFKSFTFVCAFSSTFQVKV